jgi:origin recognition complex subunit 1
VTMPATPRQSDRKRGAASSSKAESSLSARQRKEEEYKAALYSTPTKRYGSTRRLNPGSTRPQRRLAIDSDSDDDDVDESSSEESEDSDRELVKDTAFSEDQEGSSDEDTAITSDEEEEDGGEYSESEEEEEEEEGGKRKRHRTAAVFGTPNKRQRHRAGLTSTPRGGQGRILSTVTSAPHLPARPLNMTTLTLADLDGLTPQARAKKLLHVGATPEQLPCRQDQYEEVLAYVVDAVQDGIGGCVYVSGVPGVGKTATIREAIRSLKHQASTGAINSFKFVEINGMKLNDAQDAYSLLWQTLSGKRCSNRMALRQLSHHFTNSSSSRSSDEGEEITTVVLMDELDQLVTTRQEVMYNMFNWPNSKNSRLIVIAVANTMDLPERILNPKVASRLGMTRITFKPYTDKQLVEIVHSRLGMGQSEESIARRSEVEKALIIDCDKVMDPTAIMFISKRVSNVSGDARRMLDVCRRSIESVEMQTKSGDTPRQVVIEDAKKVLDSMVKSGKVSHLIKLSLQAKVALVSILSCSRKSGVAECDLATILASQLSLCRMQGITAKLNLDTISPILSQLCALGLLIAVGTGAGSGKAGMHARFILTCQEDEVRLALQQDDDPRLRNMM